MQNYTFSTIYPRKINTFSMLRYVKTYTFSMIGYKSRSTSAWLIKGQRVTWSSINIAHILTYLLPHATSAYSALPILTNWSISILQMDSVLPWKTLNEKNLVPNSNRAGKPIICTRTAHISQNGQWLSLHHKALFNLL